MCSNGGTKVGIGCNNVNDCIQYFRNPGPYACADNCCCTVPNVVINPTPATTTLTPLRTGKTDSFVCRNKQEIQFNSFNIRPSYYFSRIEIIFEMEQWLRAKKNHPTTILLRSSYKLNAVLFTAMCWPGQPATQTCSGRTCPSGQACTNGLCCPTSRAWECK